MMQTEPFLILEDNHLLAVWKPPGWLAQGDSTGDETVVDWAKNYLKIKYQKPGAVFAAPAHRLDRPVSGALLMARTSKAAERLAALFREKKVEKTYLAVVSNRPETPTGRLIHFLEKDARTNVTTAWQTARKAPAEAKESILDFEHIGELNGHNVLKIKPLTGRSHQIRAQLSAIGCPILGDVKYGARAPLGDGSIALHSFKMAFEHPVKRVLTVIEASKFPENPVWIGIEKIIKNTTL